MSTYALILIVMIIIITDIIPIKNKKQGREIIVLLMLGAITLSYGYYYNTHKYTASLVNLMFELFNMR